MTTAPTRTQIWIAAMRPRTLPLALACIIMGSALAAAAGGFRPLVLALCVITAVFLQILSNLANDYGDFVHGADSITSRQGPSRAVQSGQIGAETMRRAMWLFGGLSGVSGLLLIWLGLRDGSSGQVLIFLLLGVAAAVAAVTYTAGRSPYGYMGLGDISVLIFFGWVGVLGSYFLQTLRWDGWLILPASSCGLLAVAVLNVNNIRDIDSDREAGKFSIPVRIGPRKARIYHWLLLITAVLTTLAYVLVTEGSLWRFLFLLAVPLLVRNGTAVWQTEDPQRLNPFLKQMAISTLVYVLLFSVGQII